MTRPLERAARALAEVDPQGRGTQYWRDYVPDARAVLTAIRDPSEGMADAGSKAAAYHGEDGRPVWQAMIDAALSEDG